MHFQNRKARRRKASKKDESMSCLKTKKAACPKNKEKNEFE